MKRFTNTELADMHLIYGLAEGNAREAKILFAKGTHRDIYLGQSQTFTNLHRNFWEYESLLGNRDNEGSLRLLTTQGNLDENRVLSNTEVLALFVVANARRNLELQKKESRNVLQ
ncbi:hypothetical protein TNCV_323631 [Trichonephila clavipes]|nr:hypothetical protein TNCV_323631 [Trichonephila clavipes]